MRFVHYSGPTGREWIEALAKTGILGAILLVFVISRAHAAEQSVAVDGNKFVVVEADSAVAERLGKEFPGRLRARVPHSSDLALNNVKVQFASLPAATSVATVPQPLQVLIPAPVVPPAAEIIAPVTAAPQPLQAVAAQSTNLKPAEMAAATSSVAPPAAECGASQSDRSPGEEVLVVCTDANFALTESDARAVKSFIDFSRREALPLTAHVASEREWPALEAIAFESSAGTGRRIPFREVRYGDGLPSGQITLERVSK
jgi:hypothetical protein